MTHSLFSLRTLALAAGLALAFPATTQAHDHSYRRDLDHDGHYNTKHVDYSHHGYGGRSYGYGGRGYYGRGYGYGGYYGGYYPRYGYGYGYPYYGSGFGVTVYSRPSYGSYSYAERDDDTAADVQRALKRRGYYHGSVDGAIGPESRNAIRNFQADKHLSPTGRIDRDTLRELDLD
jgi:hypothetical protein